jgi:colanic acid biosynthesis glycosyl transferase WcaI
MKASRTRPPEGEKTLLMFSQTFVPDPASVGQHMTDVAREWARRGHRIIVYTANRGYENPALRYPARETIDGIDVRRLPFSSFGKRNILIRATGTFTFLIQCIWVGLFTRRLCGIFFSTSPPMIGVAAALVRMIRRAPIVYWAMDLNPDQLIAMGKIRPRGPIALLLEAVNRFYLRRCALIVALDRFMADRLRKRGVSDDRMLILPPWAHEEHIHAPPRAQNPFRRHHNLDDSFVVMYSGNHSPANPLTTLLDTAVRLKDDPSVKFLFIGGGLAKRDVEAAVQTHALTNVLSLPYQPLSELGNSLSAADLHVVSLGDNLAGIIHPCKIYGAMNVARPILYFGPKPSHVSDLLDSLDIGWHVAHGDVEGALAALADARAKSPEERAAMGQRAAQGLHDSLNQAILSGRLLDHLERVFLPDRTPTPIKKEIQCAP